MKAFVINLERSPDRKAHMTAQLHALGIAHEFIPATDGTQLTTEEITALYDTHGSLAYLKTPLTTNEIACAHSHLRAYEAIKAQGLPYALVLEDDVVLDPRIKTVLEETFLDRNSFDWLQIDYPPVGWPFLKKWMGATRLYSKHSWRFFFFSLLKFPGIVLLCGFEALRTYYYRNRPTIGRFYRPLYLASAYVITPTGIDKVTATNQPIRFAADMAPNKARLLQQLRMRAVIPLLAHQDHCRFMSDIGDR